MYEAHLASMPDEPRWLPDEKWREFAYLNFKQPEPFDPDLFKANPSSGEKAAGVA